jgi:hypothetical protein
MIIHFESEAKAIEDLQRNGWKLNKNQTWVSRDKSCAAQILHRPPIVAVQYWEIEP